MIVSPKKGCREEKQNKGRQVKGEKGQPSPGQDTQAAQTLVCHYQEGKEMALILAFYYQEG